MAKAAASNESKDEIEKMTVPELNAYLNKCGVTPGKVCAEITHVELTLTRAVCVLRQTVLHLHLRLPLFAVRAL